MSAAAQISPVHAANMTAKAIRLAAWITINLTVTDPRVVGLFDATMWTDIADLAHEDPPSDATVAVIVTLLRELPALPADPFDRIA